TLSHRRPPLLGRPRPAGRETRRARPPPALTSDGPERRVRTVRFPARDASPQSQPPEEDAMNVGVSVPLPAYKVDVGFMARTAEALGFESLWCAEHPIMPVHTTSKFPGSADGVIPESYSHFVDPFVALARASGTTTRIRLGTGITLVPERNPLLLA